MDRVPCYLISSGVEMPTTDNMFGNMSSSKIGDFNSWKADKCWKEKAGWRYYSRKPNDKGYFKKCCQSMHVIFVVFI